MSAHTQIDIELNAEGDISKIPATTEDIHELKDATDQASEASKENAKAQDHVKGTLTEVGHAARGGMMLWKGLGDVMSGEVSHGIHLVMRSLRMLWGVMTANPLGIVVVALGVLAGAVSALMHKWNEAKDAASNFHDDLKHIEEAAKATADELSKTDRLTLEHSIEQAKSLTQELEGAVAAQKELRRIQDEMADANLALDMAKLESDRQGALKGVTNKDERDTINNQFDLKGILRRQQSEVDNAKRKKKEAEADLEAQAAIKKQQEDSHTRVAAAAAKTISHRDQSEKLLTEAGLMQDGKLVNYEENLKRLAAQMEELGKPIERFQYSEVDAAGNPVYTQESEEAFKIRQAQTNAEFENAKKLHDALVQYPDAKANAEKAEENQRQEHEKKKREDVEHEIKGKRLAADIVIYNSKIEQAATRGSAEQQKLQNKEADEARERQARDYRARIQKAIDENKQMMKDHPEWSAAQAAPFIRAIARDESAKEGIGLAGASPADAALIRQRQNDISRSAEDQIRTMRDRQLSKSSHEGQREFEHDVGGGYRGVAAQGFRRTMQDASDAIQNGNTQIAELFAKYHAGNVQERAALQKVIARALAEMEQLRNQLNQLQSQVRNDPRR